MPFGAGNLRFTCATPTRQSSSSSSRISPTTYTEQKTSTSCVCVCECVCLPCCGCAWVIYVACGEIVHLPKCFAQLVFHRVNSATLELSEGEGHREGIVGGERGQRRLATGRDQLDHWNVAKLNEMCPAAWRQDHRRLQVKIVMILAGEKSGTSTWWVALVLGV